MNEKEFLIHLMNTARDREVELTRVFEVVKEYRHVSNATENWYLNLIALSKAYADRAENKLFIVYNRRSTR